MDEERRIWHYYLWGIHWIVEETEMENFAGGVVLGMLMFHVKHRANRFSPQGLDIRANFGGTNERTTT